MSLFVIFVFGGVILVAGTLLSPALPTSQPRIGLAAAFALALIIGGAVFWAMLFGWDTLLIDYMVFFLISVIFLGGTLSYGQKRAESRGETLEDVDQGWPGPLDLALLGIAALVVLGVVVFVAPSAVVDATPPARAAAGSPPGFRALVAYLENQLSQSMPITQYATAAVLVFISSWAAYDLGGEISGKQLGRALLIVPTVGGIFLLVNAQYEMLLGLVFALAFATFALRYTRYQYTVDAIAAGLMLGAALLAQGQVFALLVVGYIIALVLLALRRRPLRREAWAIMLLGVPLVALVATSPWLVWR